MQISCWLTVLLGFRSTGRPGGHVGAMAVLRAESLGGQEHRRPRFTFSPRRQGGLHPCSVVGFEILQARRNGRALFPEYRAAEKAGGGVASGNCAGSIQRRLLERSALA